jgi:Domain of unknown function (DUF4157)
MLPEMEDLFGASFRGVHILHAPAISRWNAAALTGGNTILFAERLADPAAPAARYLLAHELTHILQQRAGRVASRLNRDCLLLDEELEAEADRAAERAAAGKPVCALPPPRPAAPPAVGRPLAFQPELIVGSVTSPKSTPHGPSWTFTADEISLYRHMVDSASPIFSFATQLDMLAFVRKYSPLFRLNANKFSDRFKLFFAPIVGASAAATAVKALAKWTVDITVNTKGGTCTIPVFSSVKRHLVLSFMENQFTPREIKPGNSLVSDAALFETKLVAYAGAIAAELAKLPFLFGFVPKDFVHVDSEMKFITDTTEIPNTVYPGQENAIHAFPSTGSAVRSNVSREQYNAICKFLLWFFRTEEHVCEGVAYDRVARISIHDIDSRDAKRRKMEEMRNAIGPAIDALRDIYLVPAVPAVPLNQLAANIMAITGKKPHYMAALAEATKNLFQLLVEHGLKPSISGVAPARKDKPADYRAASSSAGSVRFRTHLCEVRAVAAELTPDLIAFLIGGYVARSGQEVLTYITTTQANAKPNVTNQIKDASVDTIKRLTNEPSLQVRLTNLYELYNLAHAHGINIPLLR